MLACDANDVLGVAPVGAGSIIQDISWFLGISIIKSTCAKTEEPRKNNSDRSCLVKQVFKNFLLCPLGQDA